MSAVAPAGVAERVVAVAAHLATAAPDERSRERAQAVLDRLQGPLRVAIAGRVKAGKSTLLNALVGERLAPTDAGECTRMVSRYSRGAGYEVKARLRDGRTVPLAFRRTGGALDVQLGGLRESDVATIDVSWPTHALEALTLIDTPGLASLDAENSRRTREFLASDEGHPSDADAVVYLMRHAHRNDIAFLEAFMDRSVTAASPVNAVAVLSRADEIGGGRLDSMESAARIARRYRSDPQLRGLCAEVVPIAGLLAETGLTLREEEVAALHLLSRTPADVLDLMLLSTDGFCEPSAGELTVELRRDLLGRLGLFGVRLALREIEQGRGSTAAALGPLLVEHSGLNALRALITDHFMPRARVLQARSGIVALRALARDLAPRVPALALEVDRRLEQIEAGAVQFAQVRGAHLVGSGAVTLQADDREELDRLFRASDPRVGLGLAPGAGADDVRAAALTGIGRWRTAAANPLADPLSSEVFDTAARVLESFYGALLAQG